MSLSAIADSQRWSEFRVPNGLASCEVVEVLEERRLVVDFAFLSVCQIDRGFRSKPNAAILECIDGPGAITEKDWVCRWNGGKRYCYENRADYEKVWPVHSKKKFSIIERMCVRPFDGDGIIRFGFNTSGAPLVV